MQWRQTDSMNVDVVYTWVDGSDRLWAARKAAFQAAAGRSDPAACHAARFRSVGELRYSIRSVLAYAPWVNRIHVVTDGQRPDWLREISPKVGIVDHRDIFLNPAWLPCYAARGIESQLHHIPGLAERFIYFNDDMFLGRPVTPATFFDRAGRPRVFTSTRFPRARPWHARPELLPGNLDVLHSGSVEQSRLRVMRQLDRLICYEVRHQPKAISRSLMFELEDQFPEDFAAVASARFRVATTINPFYLHAFYGIATGRARPYYLRAIRARRSWKDLAIRGLNLDDSCFVNLGGDQAGARLERIAHARPKFICINQTAETTDHDLRAMGWLMRRMWPQTTSLASLAVRGETGMQGAEHDARLTA